MFNTEYLARVTTAAVGALVLSTVSVLAAVGPVQSAGSERAVYAQVHDRTQANG
jgi:hypothetical protein